MRLNDQLYSPSTVDRQMKLDNRKTSFRCTEAQKITVYYNIYKTDSSRRYTVHDKNLSFS